MKGVGKNSISLKKSSPHFQTSGFGEPLEVGNEANSVCISRRGQIWSVKHELLRFASKPYLQPSTVHWTVKPNQPLRRNIDTNFEKRG